MSEQTKKPIDWDKYPVRICKTLHKCAICNQGIYLNQCYYDGGYGRRAHTHCVDKGAKKQ